MNCPMFLSVLFGGFLLVLLKPLPPHRSSSPVINRLYSWGPHSFHHTCTQIFGLTSFFFLSKHLRLCDQKDTLIFSLEQRIARR